MKKIAIVTFVHAYNYGAELQSFALQYKLRSIGLDVEVLDLYRPHDEEYKHTKVTDLQYAPVYSYKSKSDRKAKLHIMVARWISRVLKVLHRKRYVARKEAFWGFHVENTKLSSHPIYNFSELYSSSFDYTHYVVGSDQVWNYTNHFSIIPYLLDFVKDGQKISYAASIGHADIPEDIRDIYKNNLSTFHAISLREEQGAKIVSEITGRDDIVTVLDPTLLLSKDEWRSALKIPEIVRKPYILLYLLSKSQMSVNFAVQLAEKNDWEVKIISTGIVPEYKYKNIEYLCGVSPKVFVELFSKASFIVTNSFHGTAFAVNFNVPFISTTRRDKRYNSRFINLLKLTDLSDHLFYEEQLGSILPDQCLVCDFSVARERLYNERVKSLNFLFSAIK